MALGNSSLEQAMTLREMARERQGMQQQGQQAGTVPPQMPVESSLGVGGPPPGYGGAALGGMSEANLKQGFAEEAASIGAGGPPMPMPTEPTKQNLNEVLTTPIPGRENDSIAIAALENLAKRGLGFDITKSQGLPIAAAPAMVAANQNLTLAAQGGGLMRLAAQDEFSGQVPGRGHGMEDNVYMPIVEREAGSRVGTLAVSPDEYVVDAHTMSALGNGSADAGAEVMDEVIENVRSKAYGTTQQPNEINGLAALRPMTERV